jgi:hypothetical protein
MARESVTLESSKPQYGHFISRPSVRGSKE